MVGHLEETSVSVSSSPPASDDRLAAIYMLVVVLGISLVPLVFDLGQASERPFLFNAGWRLGVALGCLVCLAVFYRRLLLNRAILSSVLHRLPRWALVLAALGNCEYMLFAWATQYMDIAAVTVIYEVWPILLILLVERLYRREGRFRAVGGGTVSLLLIAFIGIVFVVVGQAGSIGGLSSNDGQNWGLITGLALAVGAALLAPLMAFGFRWGSDLAAELASSSSDHESKPSLEMFCAIVAFLVSSSGAAVFNTGAGLISGETIGLRVLTISVVGGALTNAIAGIAWRKVNFTTTNLGINALAYMTPVVSLSFLAMFSQVEIPRPDYLVIGMVAVVAANLLINFEAEIRWGFRSLILALGACGAVVYLRDEFYAIAGLEGWEWNATKGGYFEALGVAATVFTLLLAFRVARLVSRTRDEDGMTLSLFHRLKALAARGAVTRDFSYLILDIHCERGPALRRAYVEAQESVDESLKRTDDAAIRAELTMVASDIDRLSHSKNQGINFGELCSLLIFSGITVVLALCSRPEVSGFNGLLIEAFSMLLGTVVIFLTVNVWDLQSDRSARILIFSSGRGVYEVDFSTSTERAFEQWVSILVGLGVAVFYLVLLGHKWLDWFG